MSLAGYGYWVAVITNIGVLGGLIACGVFLFLVALMGLFGALKHHQVLLFFVSCTGFSYKSCYVDLDNQKYY